MTDAFVSTTIHPGTEGHEVWTQVNGEGQRFGGVSFRVGATVQVQSADEADLVAGEFAELAERLRDAETVP